MHNTPETDGTARITIKNPTLGHIYSSNSSLSIYPLPPLSNPLNAGPMHNQGIAVQPAAHHGVTLMKVIITRSTAATWDPITDDTRA